MPGNDDRLIRDSCDVRFGCLYLPGEAASSPVIDEGVIAVPKRVAGKKDLLLRKIHFNGETLTLKHYAPAHTNSDITPETRVKPFSS